MRMFAFAAALPLIAAPLAACSSGPDADSKPGLPSSGSGTTSAVVIAGCSASTTSTSPGTTCSPPQR